MRLFRSEEHIARWSEETGIPVGDVFSLDALWRRRTPEEANAMFAEAGLHGAFWKLD